MSKPVRVGVYEFEDRKERELGKGSYATVFQGKDLRSGMPVAIKRVDLRRHSERDKLYLNQEVGLMERVDHPNILRMHYRVVLEPYLYLVLDFCGGGDLQQYLKTQKGQRVDEDTARHFMCQLAAGLRYLHEKGIVHRDLKPHNLMLSEMSSVADLKIGDFGFARLAENEMNSVLGSPLYMAPEILTGHKYSSKADLWSVGCIFYQMLNGKSPWSPKDFNHLRRLAADKQDMIAFPYPVSDLCRDLLESLLKKNANERTGWEKFFDHEYLQPKNLMKSTIFLPSPSSAPPPVAAPVSQGSNDPPARPAEPAPVNPVNGTATAPLSRNRWLQHIICLYPHGHATTLYLRPSHTVADLKAFLARIEGVDVADQLLVDDEGTRLEDYLTLGSYSLHTKESPLYFLPLNRLRSLPERVSYPMKEIPFPDVGEVPSVLRINPSDPLRSQLRSKHLFYQGNGQKLEEYHQNMSARYMIISALVQHHEYQEKIYQVVLFKYLSKLAAEIQSFLSPCTALYQQHRDNVVVLNSSLHSLTSKLRAIQLPPSLRKGEEKTLLEAVGESRVRKEFAALQQTWSSVLAEYESVNLVVSEVVQASKDLSQRKLGENYVQTIMEGKGALGSYFTTLSWKKPAYERQLAALQKEVAAAVSGTSMSDAELRRCMNQRGYTVLDELWQECMTQDTLSKAALNKCLEAKELASLELMTRLHQILPIISRAARTKTILTTSLLPTLSNVGSHISVCQQYYELDKNFENVIMEIQRRNSFRDSINHQFTEAKEHFAKRRVEELVRRSAFSQSFVDVGVLPQSIASSLTTAIALPEFELPVPAFDLGLPKLGTKDVPSELEDEFSFLSEVADGDRIKSLEKDRADLLMQLKVLAASKRAVSPAVASSELVLALTAQLKQAKEALLSVSAGEDEALHARLAVLQKENEALKQRVNNQELVERITVMGFQEEDARGALLKCENDVEAAVALLLSA
eukprot:TRINITY_DN139_c0_g1_i1.p1 TRINITY_DN139_c0_g1~~TRINITY_DN139_c0_g1_i1.p1  ORF type:complete len:1008 (-),score=226.65 TRINITY_DN139_c0_g1_i1:193-3108(-)